MRSDAQEKIQTALLDAKPGDTVMIAAGRYELTDGLSLDVAGVPAIPWENRGTWGEAISVR